MIESFKCNKTEELFNNRDSIVFKQIQKAALRKLDMLEAATSIQDLRIPPSNHLEKLVGDREGTYSIRVNDRYRLCFAWNNDKAHDVEITDYH